MSVMTLKSHSAPAVEEVMAVLAIVGGELATQLQLREDQPLVRRWWLRIITGV